MKLTLWAQNALMEAIPFLESIDMKYLGEGKWDLREMKGMATWKTKIGGKLLSSFPSAGWNKAHRIGMEEIGVLLNPSHIADMLVSVGYREEDIQIQTDLEWREGTNEDLYTETARKELEKEEYKEFLEFIGMRYLGEGKWDIREIRGVDAWKTKIGGKLLNSFPSAKWNKAHRVGIGERGVLQNPAHITDMLVSIGYREEDIQRKVSK
ncbi:hypothetical protein AUK10_04225 [Candidatus Gracilibacteria bacterium CG2_30_37_12]|nr:MAG: hypothetical protein AUK10_04225 [Candidatus Gracilibacteria bacterium CG2_30_37_12]